MRDYKNVQIASMPHRKHMNGILSAFLMVITFALSFILIRKIENVYSTIFINFIRAMVGAFCFIVYNLLFKNFNLIFDLDVHIWIMLGASIILALVFGDFAYLKCQKYIGPTNAAVFANIAPIFTMILAILFLGEEFQWVVLLSVVIAGFGVFLLVHLQQNSDNELDQNDETVKPKITLKKRNFILGSVFGTLAALGWSFANIYTEIGLKQSEEVLHIGVQIIMVTNIIRYSVASTCMDGWWIIDQASKNRKRPEENPKKIKHFSRQSMLILLGSAILGTFLGEIFFSDAIMQVGSTSIAIIGSSLPVFLIPLNYLINKEKFNVKSLPGIVVTLSGVILLILSTG